MPIVKKECQKGDENINVNCQKAIVRQEWCGGGQEYTGVWAGGANKLLIKGETDRGVCRGL